MTDEARRLPSPVPVQDPVPAIRRSASWFYWIAALSLINLLTMAGGARYLTYLGTGISQITRAMAQSFWARGAALPALAFYTFTLLYVASFAMFARKARRLIVWPFVAGMVLYAVDSIVCIIAVDYAAIAFHAFALYMLYRGLAALLRLNKARSAAADVSAME